MPGKPGPQNAVKAHDLECLTISELEIIARDRMDKQTRDYYNEGADSNDTLRENISAYQKYRIRPRVLRDISVIDTSVNVFGHQNSMPFGVAPTAMQRLAHPEGEVATARACADAGVIMGLSSFSTTTLEDVRQASGKSPNVLQLYLFEEKEHSRKLIERAKKVGYKAVLLTVDTPMLGRRNGDLRNQFKMPPHLKIANFTEDQLEEQPSDDVDTEAEAESIMDGPKALKQQSQQSQPSQPKSQPQPRKRTSSSSGYHDGKSRVPPSGPITFHTHAPNPTLSWSTSIPWLKETAGPEMQVWVKGIATSEDALLALHHKADGIIVSNHGGRQLNGSLATLDALPEVVDAIQGKIPVHVDGGIRHGTDVFKALALGADFCWIGRPVLWGLAYKGQEGVEHCLRLLSDEFRLCMGLAGVVNVAEIGKEYLMKMDRSGFASRL